MAEIIPIQLGLTDGVGFTLWAPRWVEDGEEWEAFLGGTIDPDTGQVVASGVDEDDVDSAAGIADETAAEDVVTDDPAGADDAEDTAGADDAEAADDTAASNAASSNAAASNDKVFVFPTAAHLAAFIRTTDEHDLSDHPDWPQAKKALADELLPDEDHRFDIVGVMDLVAEPPDTWTLAELADTVAILRSLAEVCDLPVIEEVLDSSDGFALLGHGQSAFIGRQGEKLWDEIGQVVAADWDKVVEALDGAVATPPVDPEALEQANTELSAVQAIVSDEDDDEDDERDAELIFWDGVGIDPVQITVGERTGWTLRCYLDEQPVFLGPAGRSGASSTRIYLFSDPAGLEQYLTEYTGVSDAGDGGAQQNSLSELEAYGIIRNAIIEGDAAVLAGPENTYQLDGLGAALGAGPAEVNRRQLALATELLTDAATARGDSETTDALGSASPLGYLVSAIANPSPDRLPPSPPFEDEAAAWDVLVERFTGTVEWDPFSDTDSDSDSDSATATHSGADSADTTASADTTDSADPARTDTARTDAADDADGSRTPDGQVDAVGADPDSVDAETVDTNAADTNAVDSDPVDTDAVDTAGSDRSGRRGWFRRKR